MRTTRRCRPTRLAWLALPLATMALAAAPATATGIPVPRAPFGEQEYLALADRMQTRLDRLWNERQQRYVSGSGGTEVEVNAELLLVHAVAARVGHQGPTRNDHRARLVTRWLLSDAVWVEKAPAGAGDQAHAPGWVNSPRGSAQHMVFDAEVAEALKEAYLARAALALAQPVVAQIQDHLHRLARGPYWRWPTIRLNQFSWYVHVFADTATVNGEDEILAQGMRRHIRRFVAGAGGGARAAGNLGAGLRFHYLPERDLNHPMNVDSTEYANIVMSFTRVYDQAREAGMEPLRGADLRLVRQWVSRVLAGYWTHGGYMSWDSGLGFDRWHQSKKLGLTQQALIGIADAGELQPSPQWGRWAKWMLDRSLEWFERRAVRERGVPDPVFFGVTKVPQSLGSAYLGASRIEANAMRALATGLGRMRGERPPALYAYDPDIGRLAVTTPHYSTTIIAVNQGAFPYGGLDLARLSDGDGDIAANIGGRPPASFGMTVRSTGGRLLLATQHARRRVDRRVTPLRLLQAPAGTQARASSLPSRAFAAPFKSLRARGTRTSAGMTAATDYRFTPGSIVGRWALHRRSRSEVSVEVLFPSTGNSRITALLRNGRVVTVGSRQISLQSVRRLIVRRGDDGYEVTPLSRPRGATVRTIAVARQASAPQARRTLVVRLAGRTRATQVRFGARITVR